MSLYILMSSNLFNALSSAQHHTKSAYPPSNITKTNLYFPLPINKNPIMPFTTPLTPTILLNTANKNTTHHASTTTQRHAVQPSPLTDAQKCQIHNLNSHSFLRTYLLLRVWISSITSIGNIKFSLLSWAAFSTSTMSRLINGPCTTPLED
ncbi:hypothetical protein L211DRAFT_259473 [Terfezia boudieri ATCC MYA-4762]|uniref:Uncharacterized protein n=1 Tax=Terfezia boudieri ATCC MYA-4762 TaxID=1051890 RepID=A0A3N4M252_9PEZI|nr:hypothetical protein L211DRAFT_259473 [Terfezia boudieri ATCC MYA-4762]